MTENGGASVRYSAVLRIRASREFLEALYDEVLRQGSSSQWSINRHGSLVCTLSSGRTEWPNQLEIVRERLVSLAEILDHAKNAGTEMTLDIAISSTKEGAPVNAVFGFDAPFLETLARHRVFLEITIW